MLGVSFKCIEFSWLRRTSQLRRRDRDSYFYRQDIKAGPTSRFALQYHTPNLTTLSPTITMLLNSLVASTLLLLASSATASPSARQLTQDISIVCGGLSMLLYHRLTDIHTTERPRLLHNLHECHNLCTCNYRLQAFTSHPHTFIIVDGRCATLHRANLQV